MRVLATGRILGFGRVVATSVAAAGTSRLSSIVRGARGRGMVSKRVTASVGIVARPAGSTSSAGRVRKLACAPNAVLYPWKWSRLRSTVLGQWCDAGPPRCIGLNVLKRWELRR